MPLLPPARSTGTREPGAPIRVRATRRTAEGSNRASKLGGYLQRHPHSHWHVGAAHFVTVHLTDRRLFRPRDCSDLRVHRSVGVRPPAVSRSEQRGCLPDASSTEFRVKEEADVEIDCNCGQGGRGALGRVRRALAKGARRHGVDRRGLRLGRSQVPRRVRTATVASSPRHQSDPDPGVAGRLRSAPRGWQARLRRDRADPAARAAGQ